MHLIGEGMDKRKIHLLSCLESNPSHPTQQVTLLSYLTSQNINKISVTENEHFLPNTKQSTLKRTQLQ